MALRPKVSPNAIAKNNKTIELDVMVRMGAIISSMTKKEKINTVDSRKWELSTLIIKPRIF